MAAAGAAGPASDVGSEPADVLNQENVSARAHASKQSSKQQVRHRASVACASCRERRIRCVVPKGESECTQCKRSGTECIIKNDDERRRPISKAYMSSLTDRISMLEGLLLDKGVVPPPSVHPPKSRHVPAESSPKQQHQHQHQHQQQHPDEAADVKQALADFEGAPTSLGSLGLLTAGTSRATPMIPEVPSPPASSNDDFAIHDSPMADSLVMPSLTQADMMAQPMPRMTKEQSPLAGMLDTKQEDIVHRLLSTKGNLSFDQLSGRLRFFGPTANSHVYASSSDSPVSSLLDPGLEDDAMNTGNGGNGSSPYHLMAREPPEQVRRAERIIRSLTQSTYDYLMSTFWEYYNDVLQVIDQGAFDADREAVVSSSGLSSSSSASSHAKFYSSFLHITILAMGYRFADKTRDDMVRISIGNRESTLHREAKYMLDVELERPGGIPSVQALLILGDLECGVGRDNTGWMYSGMSNRLAFDIGLHLDCDGGGLPEREVRIRYMVMRACVIFDKYWALFLGRPTSIKSQDIGMDLLSRKFGSLMSSSSASSAVADQQKPPKQQQQERRAALKEEIFDQLVELMELAGRIVEIRDVKSRGGRDHHQHNHHSHHLGQSSSLSSSGGEGAGEDHAYLHTINLDRQLQNWYRRLPAHLTWKPANIKTAPYSFFLLHQQYHVTMILLHRPWARYGALSSSSSTSSPSSPDCSDSMAGGASPSAAANMGISPSHHHHHHHHHSPGGHAATTTAPAGASTASPSAASPSLPMELGGGIPNLQSHGYRATMVNGLGGGGGSPQPSSALSPSSSGGGAPGGGGLLDDGRTSLSRNICTQQAIRVARIFWQHREQRRFDGRRICVTGIQHAGTAAIALIAAFAFHLQQQQQQQQQQQAGRKSGGDGGSGRGADAAAGGQGGEGAAPGGSVSGGDALAAAAAADRKGYLGYLDVISSALRDMSDTYQPAARMDELLRAVLVQLRGGVGVSGGDMSSAAAQQQQQQQQQQHQHQHHQHQHSSSSAGAFGGGGMANFGGGHAQHQAQHHAMFPNHHQQQHRTNSFNGPFPGSGGGGSFASSLWGDINTGSSGMYSILPARRDNPDDYNSCCSSHSAANDFSAAGFTTDDHHQHHNPHQSLMQQQQQQQHHHNHNSHHNHPPSKRRARPGVSGRRASEFARPRPQFFGGGGAGSSGNNGNNSNNNNNNNNTNNSTGRGGTPAMHGHLPDLHHPSSVASGFGDLNPFALDGLDGGPNSGGGSTAGGASGGGGGVADDYVLVHNTDTTDHHHHHQHNSGWSHHHHHNVHSSSSLDFNFLVGTDAGGPAGVSATGPAGDWSAATGAGPAGLSASDVLHHPALHNHHHGGHSHHHSSSHLHHHNHHNNHHHHDHPHPQHRLRSGIIHGDEHPSLAGGGAGNEDIDGGGGGGGAGADEGGAAGLSPVSLNGLVQSVEEMAGSSGGVVDTGAGAGSGMIGGATTAGDDDGNDEAAAGRCDSLGGGAGPGSAGKNSELDFFSF